MNIVNNVNPPLDELMHHGVKGMRWGVKKSYPSGSTIRTARRNVDAQRGKLASHKIKSVVSRNPRVRAQARRRHGELKVKFLNNPDRVTAMKLTKGESVVHALLLAHPATAGATVASLAGREVVARTIARRQKAGVHNKKS